MIKRRDFLAQTALATGGMILSESILNQLFAESKNQQASASVINGAWKINPDGSFDLFAGSLSLQRCYPAIDGMAVKPLSVEISRTTIKYKLAEGSINISLTTEAGNCILSSSIEGISKAPHWFQPLGGAQVVGAEKFFHQGLGFA